MKLIRNIQELKELASDEDGIECFIALADGIARSGKNIYYQENMFYITNEIDESEQDLTEEELHTKSNIGEALLKKSLYQY